MKATNRLGHVGVAVGLALLAVTLTAFYVTNYKRHVQQSEAHVTVLVATKDIPADTTGSEILARGLLTKETVTRRTVVPGAIASPDQIRNLIAVEPIYAGEQLTTRRFGTPSQRGIRAQISGDERAYQTPGDANQLLAGTLRAGDHVDVVAAWTYPDGSTTHVSRVILQDLLVLSPPAPPGKIGGLGSPTNQTYSAQLRMTDAQSQKFEWAVANAQWHLELRPPSNSVDSPGSADTSGTLVADGVVRSNLQRDLTTPFGGPR